MKKVLVIAYFFPPIATSGSLRPTGFCRYLPALGYSPRVLTTTRQSALRLHTMDETLGSMVPDSVAVDRVGYRDARLSLIALRGRLRALMTPGRESLPKQAGIPGASIRRSLTAWRAEVLNLLFQVPDEQRGWRRPAVRHVLRLPATERPDVIFATGGPWTSLLVGRDLSRALGVPLVADFRDPWVGNPWSHRSALDAGLARRLERSVIFTARRVVANTDELREAFGRAYPNQADNIVTISNGYLGPAAEAARRSGGGDAAEAGAGRCTLAHFGSLYGRRDPFELAKALQALHREGKVAGSALTVRFVGKWKVQSAACEGLIRQLEAVGLVARTPPVTHAECLAQMARSDVLLLLQPPSPLQVPGKVFEYVAAHRPLLAIGGEGATAHLLDRLKVGVRVPNRVEDIARVLVQVQNGGLPRCDLSELAIEAHEYGALTQKLALVLDRVTEPQDRN